MQNELTLRQIVDGISALLAVMTPDGAVELVNRQILDYFGKTLEELKAWASTDAVHPDDRPGVVAAWRRSIESGEPFDSEHRQRGADSVYRWFHVQGLPVRDAEGRILRWCVLQTDIDEQKRAEDALRESERELRQIIDSVPGMINLVHNAIEAMDGGTDRAKSLVLSSRRQGEELVIHVRDHGVGIKDPTLVFEPFFTTKKSGMGMGLSICRSIVEAHGGRVWATANEDAGMTFSFTLPVASNGSA